MLTPVCFIYPNKLSPRGVIVFSNLGPELTCNGVQMAHTWSGGSPQQCKNPSRQLGLSTSQHVLLKCLFFHSRAEVSVWQHFETRFKRI